MTLIDQITGNEKGSVITSWEFFSWKDLQEKIRVTTHSPFRHNLGEAIEHTIVYKDSKGNIVTPEYAQEKEGKTTVYNIDIATYINTKPVEITVSVKEKNSVGKVFGTIEEALRRIFT